MKGSLKHTMAVFGLCAVGLLSTLPSQAASPYPNKPISLVVPFAPGGSSDIIARSLAPALGKALNQTIVVENYSGAGGIVGTQRAVRAAADGYTILLGSGSEILINKLINPDLSYDGIKDLEPVAFVATGPMVLVGNPELPAKDITSLLEYAKQEGQNISFASAGNGTPMHVAGELLNMKANLAMTHVPYRGAAPALVDILGGQVELGIATLSAAQNQIKAGKLIGYAVTTNTPFELTPDIPALGQIPGLEGFDLGVWFGLFVPVGTPSEIVDVIEQASQTVLNDPAVQRLLAEQGVSPSTASGEDLKHFLLEEVEKYQAVVKAAQISIR